MDFKPQISDDLRYMDPRIFEEPLMGNVENHPGEKVAVHA